VHLRLPAPPLRGAALLFHGCTHEGRDFFRLLEERAIVEALLRRGFAAVAFTSANRRTGCWSGLDLPRVRASVERLALDRALPLFAFGASSGGSFVTTLPQAVAVDGVVCQISAGARSVGDSLAVPIVFIYMAGDRRLATQAVIDRIRDRLKERGVPSEGFEVQPFDLGGRTIHEKLPEFVDAAAGQALVEELTAKRFLQATGRLSADPRRTQIVEATIRFLNRTGVIRPGEERLVRDNFVELYNVAWGVHEMTRERVMDGIDFLMDHRKKSAV
jgi:hypothetical protein